MQEFSLVILGDIRKSPLLPGCWEFLGIFYQFSRLRFFTGATWRPWCLAPRGNENDRRPVQKSSAGCVNLSSRAPICCPPAFTRRIGFYCSFLSFSRFTGSCSTFDERLARTEPIKFNQFVDRLSRAAFRFPVAPPISHQPKHLHAVCFSRVFNIQMRFVFPSVFLAAPGRGGEFLFFFLCFLGSFWLEPVWASAVIQLISHIFINSYEIYCCAASKLNLSQVHFGLTWLKFNRTVNSFYFFSEFRVENRIRAIFFVCGGGGRSYCRRAPPLPHQYPIKTDTLLQLLKSSSRTPSTRQGFSLVRFPLAFPLIFVLLHQVEDQQLDQRRLAPNLDEFYRA